MAHPSWWAMLWDVWIPNLLCVQSCSLLSVLEIPTGPSVRGRQLWRRTGNFLLFFLQFYVYDLRFKAWGPATFLLSFKHWLLCLFGNTMHVIWSYHNRKSTAHVNLTYGDNLLLYVLCHLVQPLRITGRSGNKFAVVWTSNIMVTWINDRVPEWLQEWWHLCNHYNPSPPSATYMHQRIGVALV